MASRRTRPAEQHPDVVAAFDELPRDVRTEEAARPDDQFLCARHGVNVAGPTHFPGTVTAVGGRTVRPMNQPRATQPTECRAPIAFAA